MNKNKDVMHPNVLHSLKNSFIYFICQNMEFSFNDIENHFEYISYIKYIKFYK